MHCELRRGAKSDKIGPIECLKASSEAWKRRGFKNVTVETGINTLMYLRIQFESRSTVDVYYSHGPLCNNPGIGA